MKLAMIAASPGHVAGQHRAARLHARQALVVGLKLGVGRHIDFAAIGVTGDDAQLLPARENAGARSRGSTRIEADRRIVRRAKRHPSGDPARTVS